MTDDQILMQGIEAVVRAVLNGGRPEYESRPWLIGRPEQRLSVWPGGKGDPPPLPPEKVFALKVLAGDPATLPQALADYLMDDGHEYAEGVAERARQEERARCLRMFARIEGLAVPREVFQVCEDIRDGVAEPTNHAPPPSIVWVDGTVSLPADYVTVGRGGMVYLNPPPVG